MMKTSFLLSAWTLFAAQSFAYYVLDTDFFTVDTNGSFFDKFNFINETDPTHGTVSYRNYSDCRDLNLIQNTTENIIMRVDSTNALSGDDGRPSVRIESKKKFYKGLIVVDVDHMPASICGVWPAFWTYGPDWPKNGEIDIIEGINQFQANRMTLHTAPGCYTKNQSTYSQQYSGSLLYTNCTAGTGCSIGTLETNTYGDGFNAIGGGIYATEWTEKYISIYFFPRDLCEQNDIIAGPLGKNPDPSTWGIPLSRFDLTCNIERNFRNHSIVFDTTFCGDWADGANQWNSTIPVNTTWPPYATTNSGSWLQSGKKHGFGPYFASNSTCAAKTGMICKDWVKKRPEAFKEAYWSVNALRVYQEYDGLSSYADAPGSLLDVDVEVDVDLSLGSGEDEQQDEHDQRQEEQGNQQQEEDPSSLLDREASPHDEPEAPKHGHFGHHKHKHRH
ncbi:hypothetical protein CKM354_000591900 [Cercospora kikuchii]|uniref:GH16 domain-containing protein n=1 Tax=Cercospora kikuchii TaxID=84275 RepID=A0A9P3FHP9_9PEZI|nr:uncharacterized protein CKM354_000591900 [Cercospora kikuchii]GIZ42660.1 hypothetical protein CKM354_000591900 [Cercospora kikuchii]